MPRQKPSAADIDLPSSDDAHADLASRLRQAREYLGLSQEAVAEHLGIPRASVSAIEAGRRKVSSIELRDLAKLYKRPVTYFLGETPPDEALENETVRALFRTTRNLTDDDKEQVLRFAQFLGSAGEAPARRSS